jgi:hypothetical protein
MTLEQVIKQSQNGQYLYPDVFAADCGLDIILPEKKLHAVKLWEHDQNRCATVEIDTFIGISPGAIHYYGKISIQGVGMEYDEEPGCYRMIFDRNTPLAHNSYTLRLQRPLSREEITRDPERWNYCREGDLTECFNTPEEIIALAKEVFRLRFTGDWDFYVKSPYKNYNKKLNINKHETNSI